MLTLLERCTHDENVRSHFVVDERETLLWSGQFCADALAWLHDQGHGTVLFDTGGRKYDLRFTLRRN